MSSSNPFERTDSPTFLVAMVLIKLVEFLYSLCLAFIGLCPVSRTLGENISFQDHTASNFAPVLHANEIETDNWELLVKGHTGVSAMQITVVSDKYALIFDRVEHNPLQIKGHPAWGALYNLDTHEVKPLDLKSNSFCAGGGFLGNGTLISFGGNPASAFKPGEFGDTNGLQSIRFYTPCDDGECSVGEYDQIKLTSPRWYSTAARLGDGSLMIVGGSRRGAFRNSPSINNPTIEYFPAKLFSFATKHAKTQIYSPFLDRTLGANLFPIVITLPMSNLVFMAANQDTLLYNWKTNKQIALPSLPNGVRVTYPMTGGALMLPVSLHNWNAPEILICGGSTLDDRKPTPFLSASAPASAQCARMIISKKGVMAGWQVEQMPNARIMPDLVMLPDGKILIVNGGKTGLAGYGGLRHMVGNSHADTPNLTPVLYDPDASPGQRFSSKGLPTSKIPRLYHSVATLTPSGRVMLAGSNPNPDVTTKKYRTEYRVEWLVPPYVKHRFRPIIAAVPQTANYQEIIKVKLVKMKPEIAKQNVQAVLLDLGFVTHSIHMNSRLVRLRARVDLPNKEINVEMPHLPEIYPPGHAWLHILVNGIPSPGKRILVGSGQIHVRQHQ